MGLGDADWNHPEAQAASLVRQLLNMPNMIAQGFLCNCPNMSEMHNACSKSGFSEDGVKMRSIVQLRCLRVRGLRGRITEVSLSEHV